GEVVEAGPGVAAVAVGDYVAAESHITCAVCFQCRTGNAHVCQSYRILGHDDDGAYAGYVRLPGRVLWKTSREIPPEFACLQEPLGNAVHAALVEDLTGQSVLITGCGPTGLFATAVARTAGAGVIIASDISDYRLGLAKQLGADYTINPTRDDTNLITRVTGGEGVDVALEMSGSPTAIHSCFLYVKNGGRVTLFGIPEAQGTAINHCANNYLGLADHPAIVAAAAEAVRARGYGMASVRFICGTQDLHKDLERAITLFLGTGDTLLYSSCFDANTGLFETLLSEQDAILSDALNHARVIDGIRLCKAQRYRYAHGDMAELGKGLRETAGRRIRLIATDGVFSMDGDFARLDAIVALAEQYGALVMVDDSHATGFIGPTGRGTPELLGVADKVDL